MDIVLIAEESAGLQVLRALGASHHRVVAVMARPPQSARVRGDVWTAALEAGIETWPANLVKNPALGNRLRNYSVDLILNVHSLYIFHKNVLTAPRFGAFNLHPGPLPRYAGLNSISWALYHGEKTHGVTIHRMEPEIDSGPIVYQSWFPIAPQDTAFSLGFKCVKAGLQLVNKLLETMASDATKLPLTAQDLSKREYFPPGPPQGGRLSWFSPAEKIVNYVRASDYFPFRSPWGHPRSRLGEREIAIAKAEHTDLACSVPPGTVGERSGTGALVAALDKWVLVRKVKIGDRYWAAGDILSPGYRLTMWPRARPQEIAAEIPFVSRGCLRGQG